MSRSLETRQRIRQKLLDAYDEAGLWEEHQPIRPLPPNVTRGSAAHLAFLTLVFTISGGREPTQLWDAARITYGRDPHLFAPDLLARANPKELVAPLQADGLLRKKSYATVWQRIGQAIIMRGGSVSALLAREDNDALQLLDMLAKSKSTFPVLSGEQTAPRWLYGLATIGEQPLKHADKLIVPLSPEAEKVLGNLEIDGERVSAEMFAPLTALGRYGCQQRRKSQAKCPAAAACPVAAECQYAQHV